ncbi:MAG: hypothetical protein V1492_01450 [Candidatus Micrarchaeota archaeon]
MAKYKMNVPLLSLSGPLFIIALAILLFAFGLSQEGMNTKLGFSVCSVVLVMLAATQIYIVKSVAYEINDDGLKITGVIANIRYNFSELEGFRTIGGFSPFLFSVASIKGYSALTHRIFMPGLGFEISQPAILIETNKIGKLTKIKTVLAVNPESREQFIAELKKRKIPELK